MLDALQRFRALPAILQSELNDQCVSESTIQAVQHLGSCGRSLSLCSKVGALILKHDNYVASLLGNFQNLMDGLDRVGPAFAAAYKPVMSNDLQMGVRSTHTLLASATSSVVEWQLSLRPAKLDAFSFALQECVCSHCEQVLSQGGVKPSLPEDPAKDSACELWRFGRCLSEL